MKFRRYKPKALLSIILSIAMLLTTFIVPSNTITAYADNAGGGGEGGGTAEDTGSGASESKCGFRMYVVDDQGNLKSKVIDLVYQTPTFNANTTTTRIGGGNTNDVKIMPSDMPRPYFYSGTFVGNGMAVKQWMRDKDSSGQQHIVSLIENNLGADILELFQDQSSEVFCVLEPITWHSVYTGIKASTNSGITFYGTFYNWMQLYQANGITDPFTYQLDNNVLGRCLILERDQSNLGLSIPTSGGMLDLATVGNQGFGIQLYSNLDFEGTHTWDYPLGDTPGKPPISNGKMNIVKNYRTEIKEGEYTDDGCFSRQLTDSRIKIEDEESYVVIGWKITNSLGTPDSINWSGTVPGTATEQGKAPKTVTIKKPSTTLYVLLEKQEIQKDETLEADYKLGESQITRAISLKIDDQGDNILNGYKFNWNFSSLKSCGGHPHPGGHSESCPDDCSNSHTYITHCNFSLDNTDWTFKLQNSNRENYPTNLSINNFWTDYNSEEADTRGTLDAGSIEKEFDHQAVVHRGNDTLSISQWKNENEALSSLANFNTANSKSPTRKKADFTESVTFLFDDNSVDKTTTSKGSEGCNPSDDAVLTNPLTTDVSILYKTYSGASNGGKVNTDINTREMLTIGSAGNKVVSGRMINSGLQFNFHPYIKMRYDTMDAEGNITKDNEVYILGEYTRGMNLNDYAEIEWRKATQENLTLSSAQWSIHNTPIAKWGPDSLLPGGSRMTLGIKKSNRQKITVRTYQCILDDKGREQVEQTSHPISGYTKETALQYHKAYAQSIITGLENLSVEQWQNKKATSDPFKGIPVYNEANISSLENSTDGKASKESKYYFKNERSNQSDSGCLDVKEIGTSTNYYTFSSDTSGNILMDGSIILTKDQGIESLSGIALAINSKTMVVTKLVDAIERNTGNDADAAWVNDGHWYNEAFDGITVAVSSTSLTTGFIDPYERDSILDPKLNTKNLGKNDFFSSYMVGQFKMHDYSAAYGMKNVLGEFKGFPIMMKDMDRLYYSKKFYISNITTQDLH